MTRIKTLYTCIICGASFDKRQALRGHMNKHKDVKLVRISWLVPEETRDKFYAVCAKHKTTTCHVGYTLMKAAIKGDETGMIDLAAKNPLIVNMLSFFNGRPRGRRKWDLAPFVGDRLTQAVTCIYLDHKDWNKGRLGWCRDLKKWVTPDVCTICVKPDRDS